MWLNEFRDRLEEDLHRLLWRQWSRLGVAGDPADPVRWIIDPEALLLFTLEAARTEPRLFDEVLDWLILNGTLMDVQRLRNVMAVDGGYPSALVAATASLLADHDPSAKWDRLAGTGESPGRPAEPLFTIPAAGRRPEFRALDVHFERAGYLRSPFKPRGLSRAVPNHDPACLRFRLRGFFGIGIRSEAAAFLLTHDAANGDDVARGVSYSFPGVQQILREMAGSGLIHVRRQGREKHFWLDKARWWSFLGNSSPAPQDGRPVAWVGWARFFRGTAGILRFLRRTDLGKMTAYIQASEFCRTVEDAKDDLEGGGLPVSLPPRGSQPVEGHAREVSLALLDILKDMIG